MIKYMSAVSLLLANLVLSQNVTEVIDIGSQEQPIEVKLESKEDSSTTLIKPTTSTTTTTISSTTSTTTSTSSTSTTSKGLSNDDIEFILSQANSTLLDIAFNEGDPEIIDLAFSSSRPSLLLKALQNSKPDNLRVFLTAFKPAPTSLPPTTTEEALIERPKRQLDDNVNLKKANTTAPADVTTDSEMFYEAVKSAATAGELDKLDIILSQNDDSPIVNRASLTRMLSKALLLAAERGHVSIVSHLLDKYDLDVNYSESYLGHSLIIAVDHNYKVLAELLLEKGADVNKPAFNNKTALTSLCRRLSNDYLPLLQLLIAHNASVNHQDDLGEFALKSASNTGFTEVIEVLLSNGAEINLQDISGYTSLMQAAKRGNYEAVKILIEHGADTEIVENRLGKTAFLIAAENAPWNAWSNYVGMRKSLNELYKAGADILKQDSNGDTALTLMVASRRNPDPRLVSFLVDLYTDNNFINAQNKKGETALMLAEKYGSDKVVPVLLGAGSRTELVDAEGLFALDKALEMGNNTAAGVLRAPGAHFYLQVLHIFALVHYI